MVLHFYSATLEGHFATHSPLQTHIHTLMAEAANLLRSSLGFSILLKVCSSSSRQSNRGPFDYWTTHDPSKKYNIFP